MGRMYSVPFTATFTTAGDFLEIRAPEGIACVLHSLHMASDKTSSEKKRITINRHPADATSGSGGSAATIARKQPGDPAAGSAAEQANTTRISGGTGGTVVLKDDFMDLAGGYDYVPAPEVREVWSDQQYLSVGLEAAPAASTVFRGTADFEEVG